MIVAMTMVMLMKEGGADNVECETDAADYEDNFGILDFLDLNETFNRLESDTQAKS